MTLTNSIIPQMDQQTLRRRALADVYRLLIRLAEEAEHKSDLPEPEVMQEKTSDISPNQETLLSKEA